MRSKLIVLIVYVIGITAPVVLLAGQSGPAPAGQAGEQVIMLNVKGVRTRGPVRFDHKEHEALISPDPNWPYNPTKRDQISETTATSPLGESYKLLKSSAACSVCHHTVSNFGVPQLWKCTTCHGDEGRDKSEANLDLVRGRRNLPCGEGGNPKNRDCDEVFFERAFHDSCIGCHRAYVARGVPVDRAPVACSGCHQAMTGGMGRP